jgi:hypothetical protein
MSIRKFKREGDPTCFCPRCKLDKNPSEFTKSSSRNNGLRTYCKECTEIMDKPKRSANKERTRDLHYIRTYGISLKIFNEMYSKQDGACAICHKHVPLLRVDHDHGTGKVRGLLCGNCNVLLRALDDKTFLESAIQYLGGDA